MVRKIRTKRQVEAVAELNDTRTAQTGFLLNLSFGIDKRHRSGIIRLTSHGLYLQGLEYQYSGREMTLNGDGEGDA